MKRLTKVLLNAAITGAISCVALLSTNSNNPTVGVLISALIAGTLSFLIELKNELSGPPPSNGSATSILFI